MLNYRPATGFNDDENDDSRDLSLEHRLRAWSADGDTCSGRSPETRMEQDDVLRNRYRERKIKHIICFHIWNAV